MKQYLTLLFTLFAATAWSQQDSATGKHSVYELHSIQATLSLGFIDAYRHEFSIPTGFEKNNTSGYANVAAKIDYALSRQVSLAANFGYDAFIYNYSQQYQGNNGPFVRNRANDLRIFNLGLIAFYHLGNIITIKRLDPFIGAGISLNNLRYSSYPQGDSSVVRFNHTVTPYLKVGAHYYISDRFSIFGDLGYDKESILSLGFSCRFFPKRRL